ncbi:MAG: hypothetical protein AAGE01_26160, partial [Pseudomonadota bacterium]
ARTLQQRISSSFGGRTPQPVEKFFAALAGEVPNSEAVAAILDEPSPIQCVTQDVSLLAFLGAFDEAIARAGECLDDGDPYALQLNMIPELDPVRDDPRFRAILARMNLPVEDA